MNGQIINTTKLGSAIALTVLVLGAAMPLMA
jgi:hypothetical protein